jgi:threonine dehydrogenase-like Zn-dependent dehydrogenase
VSSHCAAVLAAPRRFELMPIRRSDPGPGEVRIAVLGSGLCGSNVPLWEGRDWFAYPCEPGAPGHEAWGTVDVVGDGAALRPGDPVAFLCDRALAETAVVDARVVVALPRALLGKPFPGEALGCATNVAARSGWRAGDTVAVVGAGFLGTLVGALAAADGARVVAVSRRPSALAAARAMGAAETVLADDRTDVVGAVAELTGGRWCEVVVEAGGVQATLDLAGRITGERGRLVVAGYHQDGLRQVDMQLWCWRGIDVVHAHERDPAVAVAGIRAAVAAVASGRLDPEPLYTHRVGLDRVDDGMALLVDRPEGFMKALVVL